MKTLSVGLRSILVSSIQSFIIGLQVVLCSVKLGLVGNEEDLMFLEIEFICFLSSVLALVVISKLNQINSRNMMTSISIVMVISN